jgi:hypothetical protein
VSEQWRAVVGLEGLYEVSDLGAVRSLDRVIPFQMPYGVVMKRLPGVPLRPSPDTCDYLSVNLRGHSTRVHLLVLQAFSGPRPDEMVARHLNGNHRDNRLANLAWGTRQQNAQDMIDHGKSMRGDRSPAAKLTPADVLFIRSSSDQPRELSARFGIHRVTVRQIQRRLRWRWLEAA